MPLAAISCWHDPLTRRLALPHLAAVRVWLVRQAHPQRGIQTLPALRLYRSSSSFCQYKKDPGMTMTTREFNDAIELLGTREQAADALGISPRTLQRLRAGSYDVSAHNQAALAKALLDKGKQCIQLASALLAEEPAAS
jgi:hypothetical protein